MFFSFKEWREESWELELPHGEFHGENEVEET
jgi:hypothetical protein